MPEPALWLAEKFAGFAEWVAENPKKAILVGLAGATLRAAIESTFRASIEASIYRGTGAIVTASAPAATGLTTVGTQAGFASAGLARVAALTGVFLLAMGAVYAALDQAEKLKKELAGMMADLGKGTGAAAEDPESEVGKARAKAKRGYVRAAETMEEARTSPLKGAVMAGPMGGGAAGAAFLRVQGEIEGMKAARKAVGEGKTATTRRFTPFDVSKTAASTEDVMAKLDPRNWAVKGEGTAAAPSNKEVVAKLDQLNATLSKGVKVTNPEDFQPKPSGSGVDNSARDIQ